MGTKVTIIIPTYNREKYILEALVSAANQTYKNIEILVTDNCSTDKTVEIVKDFAKTDSRVKIISNDKNVGPLLNWKSGLENADGEYVKILWSDDLIQENFLESAVPILKKNVGFVVSPIKIGKTWTDSKDFIYDLNIKQTFKSRAFVHQSLVGASIPVSPGCSLFRKKDLLNSLTLENSIFMSDRFKINGAGPDLLFFLKTCSHYEYVGFAAVTKSFFRDHPGSITVGEKAKMIGMDYLKAKLFYTSLINHRFYYGILFEICLRDKKSFFELKNKWPINLKFVFGFFEYVLKRSFYFAKRRFG